MKIFYTLLLFAHVLGAVVWVGGMFMMQTAIRPAAAELLEPPLRLPLLVAVLERFFRWVTVAVLVMLASGLAMIFGGGGFAAAHVSVHLMFGLGLLMTAIYAFIRIAPFRQLKDAVAARDWASAAGPLGALRKLVATNLALGILTIGVAIVGRIL